MQFIVLTLFPAMFENVLAESILKLAGEKGLLRVKLVDFREYSLDKHKKVDDKPYGGGPGMLLTPQPLIDAVLDVEKEFGKTRRILLSPQGKPLKHSKVIELAKVEKPLLLICGRYEGFDERIRLILSPEEISVGDFVMSGGEIPAMALIDAVTRLLPGALGGDGAAEDESFSQRLLEYPQYTRPAEFRGLKVPDVLQGGHHKNILDWRKKQSLRRTKQRRPDLLNDS